MGTPTAQQPMKRIRVWFGDNTLCEYDAAPDRARRYATLTEQRFRGLRVTVDPAPADDTAERLPTRSLWHLTVK